MVQLLVVAPDKTRSRRIADAAEMSNVDLDVVEIANPGAATETIGADPRDQDVLVLADVPDRGTLDDVIAFKTDDATRRIPVICMIHDPDPEMVAEAYGSHVNACVKVPEADGDLEAVVRETVDFFVGKVRLAGSTGRGG